MTLRSFTLLEILVVIVMLGILAGVILPRTAGFGAARARQEAMAVRDLLTQAAERGALRHESVAVQYDAEAARLTMLVQREQVLNGQTVVQWRPDVLAPGVQLELLRVGSGTLGTRSLDTAGFIVDVAGAGLGEGRPMIAFVLVPSEEGAGRNAGTWRVELPENAAASVAEQVEPSRAGRALRESRLVDLDAQGRSFDPW